MGGGMDYSGIILRLGKKTEKTAIGMKKADKSEQESTFKRKNVGMKRTRIKPISPKGRKRNKNLKAKLEVIISIQEQVYGRAMCEATRGHKDWKHKCPCLGSGRDYPLVLDHVEGRNNENADRYENLQVLCSWANFQKGSIRGLDFRSPEMMAAMVELDRSSGKAD
jgi:5-methylcytosine-specific restriction endonuclease McrA